MPITFIRPFYNNTMYFPSCKDFCCWHEVGRAKDNKRINYARNVQVERWKVASSPHTHTHLPGPHLRQRIHSHSDNCLYLWGYKRNENVNPSAAFTTQRNFFWAGQRIGHLSELNRGSGFWSWSPAFADYRIRNTDSRILILARTVRHREKRWT